MGKKFGNLYYMRNIVYHRVSSYEQKAFPNFWRESFKNIVNEVRFNAPFILPPFAICAMTYYYLEQEKERLMRKNPNDFINDE